LVWGSCSDNTIVERLAEEALLLLDDLEKYKAALKQAKEAITKLVENPIDYRTQQNAAQVVADIDKLLAVEDPGHA
jgi:hypothetical protein